MLFCMTKWNDDLEDESLLFSIIEGDDDAGSLQPSLTIAPQPPTLIDALNQFTRNLHAFDDLFDVPAVCDRELMLRSQMRETLTQLALTLSKAAVYEQNRGLARTYAAAAITAARLAVHGPCRTFSH